MNENTVFARQFEALTGNLPFPWQEALYNEWFSEGKFPETCNLPTGLGKTSIIAVWLLALAKKPQHVPRRLVYVVNRRTVVDQTTNEVEKYRERMAELAESHPLKKKIGSLAISTLRGQFADNREWSADPARPAIICGTVDMIGSRLLFSGYGCGFKTRPLQAGFLGQDALLIHDEAHLEPAFQKLVEEIRDEQKRCQEFRKFQVVELSATARSEGVTFGLTPLDKRNTTVKKRFNAHKELHLRKLKEEKKLADEIADWALKHRDSGEAILIFVRSVEDVRKITEKLQKEKQQWQTLTGTLRGMERDRMADPRQEKGCPIFARFLPRPKPDCEESERWKIEPQTGTVYLVCTSAGEVGVNISADHLVCDLTPYDSMAQRFGRVNRFGLCNTTTINVLCPQEFDETDPYESACMRTLSLLRKLESDASPKALGDLDDLDPEEKLAAFTPKPILLPTSDILFDAWSLTSINKPLPGRPPVDAYLHGLEDEQKAETMIAWREEVWELGRNLQSEQERREFEDFAEELLEDYPLKPHELLRDSTFRKSSGIKAKLAKMGEKRGDLQVWVQDSTGEITIDTLAKIAESMPLAGRTVLLPPQAGGLLISDDKSQGMFSDNAEYRADLHRLYDVADESSDTQTPLRRRIWQGKETPEDEKIVRKMKCVREIKISHENADDDVEPEKVWLWFVRTQADDAPNVRSAKQSYDLQLHLDDAKQLAEELVDRLHLPENIRKAVILASAFHDLGKRRKVWQNNIGNFQFPKIEWAKSGQRIALVERSRYRHEFGSLLDIESETEFKILDVETQELVLHLIAAHHGRARPHFPTEEAFDHEPQGRNIEQLAIDIPRRFARLQRQYGRWGLAYLESLVRAVDIAASKKAEQGATS